MVVRLLLLHSCLEVLGCLDESGKACRADVAVVIVFHVYKTAAVVFLAIVYPFVTAIALDARMSARNLVLANGTVPRSRVLFYAAHL